MSIAEIKVRFDAVALSEVVEAATVTGALSLAARALEETGAVMGVDPTAVIDAVEAFGAKVQEAIAERLVQGTKVGP